MAPSDNTHQGLLPLHHLLKRRETEKLLAEFKALLPGVDLALLRVDGRLFVSTDGWPQTTLTDHMAWLQQLTVGSGSARGSGSGGGPALLAAQPNHAAD